MFNLYFTLLCQDSFSKVTLNLEDVQVLAGFVETDPSLKVNVKKCDIVWNGL